LSIEKVVFVLQDYVSEKTCVVYIRTEEVVAVLEQLAVDELPNVCNIGVENTFEVDHGCFVPCDDVAALGFHEGACTGD
jgi:hypothetical protein